MKSARHNLFRAVAAGVAFVVAAFPSSVLACSACFGRSDSKMAEGMNWGIFTLLGVVVSMLGAVATFMVYLAKKSAAVSGGQSSPAQTTQTTEKA